MKKGENREYDPKEIMETRCSAICEIQIESIFVSSSSVNLQVKLNQASVVLEEDRIVEPVFPIEIEDDDENEQEW